MTGNCEAKPRAWRYCRETAEKLQMSLAVSKNRTLANGAICRVGEKKLQETAEKLQNFRVNKIKGLVGAKEKLQETAEKLQAQNVSTAHPAVVCCSIACSPEGHAYAHEGAQTFLINLSCRKENEMARRMILTIWPGVWQVPIVQHGQQTSTARSRHGSPSLRALRQRHSGLQGPTICLRRARSLHTTRWPGDVHRDVSVEVLGLRSNVRVQALALLRKIPTGSAVQEMRPTWGSGHASPEKIISAEARFFGTAQKAFLNRSP